MEFEPTNSEAEAVLGGLRAKPDRASARVETERILGAEEPWIRRLRVAERVPMLSPATDALLRLRRHATLASSGIEWATRRSTDDLPVPVKRHKLPLPTRGAERSRHDSLRTAAERLDGLILRPGQEVSFCRAVGKLSWRPGYLVGRRPGQDEADAAEDLAQLASLLHWMVLHTPMVVTERSDPSPDSAADGGRGLPWGVGCTIHYNYVDLRFRNDGPASYQLRISADDRSLSGEIRSDRAQSYSYQVFVKDERYLQRKDPKSGDQWLRMNELWRNVIDRRTGDYVRRELIKENRAVLPGPPSVGGGPRADGADDGDSGLGGAEVVQ